MPDEKVTPADADTVAAVLRRDAEDRGPGGGGLGGASAADPLGGSARAAGATTRNSPIDAATPAPDADEKAEHDAAIETSRSGPAEPHPKSL